MESSVIKKINSFGKFGYIASNVLKILIMIATIAVLVGSILLYSIPKESLKVRLFTSNNAMIELDETFDFSRILDLDETNGYINLGGTVYKLVSSIPYNAEMSETVFYPSNLKFLSYSIVITNCALIAVFHFLSKLCKYFKDCKTPFSNEVSDGLKKLSISLILMFLSGNITESITNSIYSGFLNISLKIDLVTLLFVFCIFMLSFIFKYGTELQNKSNDQLNEPLQEQS